MPTEAQRRLFERLVSAEPRLAELLAEAQRFEAVAAAAPYFCANLAWYGTARRLGLKATLVELVGWQRRGDNVFLASTEAYDAAYWVIYAALPDCRHRWFGVCW